MTMVCHITWKMCPLTLYILRHLRAPLRYIDLDMDMYKVSIRGLKVFIQCMITCLPRGRVGLVQGAVQETHEQSILPPCAPAREFNNLKTQIQRHISNLI